MEAVFQIVILIEIGNVDNEQGHRTLHDGWKYMEKVQGQKYLSQYV